MRAAVHVQLHARAPTARAALRRRPRGRLRRARPARPAGRVGGARCTRHAAAAARPESRMLRHTGDRHTAPSPCASTWTTKLDCAQSTAAGQDCRCGHSRTRARPAAAAGRDGSPEPHPRLSPGVGSGARSASPPPSEPGVGPSALASPPKSAASDAGRPPDGGGRASAASNMSSGGATKRSPARPPTLAVGGVAVHARAALVSLAWTLKVCSKTRKHTRTAPAHSATHTLAKQTEKTSAHNKTAGCKAHAADGTACCATLQRILI